MKDCCCSTTAPCGATDIAAPENTSSGGVLETGARLSLRDRLDGWKARWGIGRMRYTVMPGVYRLGNPSPDAPVLVTANYKMTFDRVRKELPGTDAWMLVLDTKGINVWCAAGKGTFGTDELVRRIYTVNLASLVSHRTLILPQLGAPGVAAHEVRKKTGFKVVFGPVYARDLPRFLASGMTATPDMRRVRFGLKDRLELIPMELLPALKWVPVISGVLALFRMVDGSGLNAGFWKELVPLLGSVAVGATAFQVLLPWIPGRSFAFKGWLLGVAWAIAAAAWLRPAPWAAASNLFILPPLSAFLALNFTGSSTFTSLSGVKKEMRIAVPAMAVSAGLGIVLRFAPRLFS